MKKLLIITNGYPHKYNIVAGIFVRHQVEELAKHYEVRVLATCQPYHFGVESASEDSVSVTRIYYPIHKRFFLTGFFSYPFFVLPTVSRLVTAWKPDLIHVHDFRHLPELYWLQQKLKHFIQPRYLTLHNLRTHPQRLSRNPLKWLYQLTLPLALRGWKHVFTVNNRLQTWVTPYNERVSTIGNAIHPAPQVDQEAIKPWLKHLSASSYKLVSVGNLVKEKGFDLLIGTVSNLIKGGLDVQLMIIGDGKERTHLTELIRQTGTSDRIILTGSLDNAAVRSLFAHFDAFALPSYSESFGIVYLEAMEAGLPVIGVKGQGIDGVVIDGINGLLVKPQDRADLEMKLRWLNDHPEEAKAMAAAGQNKVISEYRMDKLITKIRNIYER
jgi:glycosyltransferase involved in cell wall biosynthesis